ncbi:MAG TPA: FKBP-type peptidyl-prolyl cis-trans isomerase [Gemmatimonadaceae bacterium]|nr:FKBP-type peptidyl-prolyl cis-trans isomerase [Gemmatimonadaceae bacterium]
MQIQPVFRRALLACVLVAASAAAFACNSDDPVPAANPDPAMNSYASELGVNLAQMTRTSSGLYLQDLLVGTGAEAKAGDSVQVHYTGWLPNGQKFDSSRDRNKPFEFRLGAGRVIQGWDEGVAGMKVGGRRKLVVPANLGYGSSGIGPIPPNSVLVFDVELLGMK